MLANASTLDRLVPAVLSGVTWADLSTDQKMVALRIANEMVKAVPRCVGEDIATQRDGQVDIYQSAIARARETARGAIQDLDMAALCKSYQESDSATLATVCNVLRKLGAFPRSDADLTIDTALGAGRVIQQYHKLVRRWIFDLADAGVLVKNGDRVRSNRLYKVESADNIYFEEMSAILFDILTGKHHVLEYVFGDRRPAWFTAYTAASYDTDPVFAYQHAIVSDLVRVLAGHAALSKPLRIVEVGAGTGGLTAKLLPLLKKGYATYLYTDVTGGFLDEARKRFRHAESILSYGVYDINKDPIQNNIRKQQFDMVVAFDVLHCARDMGKMLAGLFSLLRTGGILVNEQLTKNRLGHLLIPGIMPGYTDFEDERLEQCRTLLTPTEWRKKLTASGFTDCHIFPEDNAVLDELGQGVIIARRP